MSMRSVVFTLFAALAAVAPAQAQHDHNDMMVAVDDTTNQLVVDFNFDDVSNLIPVHATLNGFYGDEPGFEASEVAEPDEGLTTMSLGADIWLEVVSVDPALSGNPLTDNLSTAGDELNLGDHLLHEHINFFINSDEPSYDPAQPFWGFSFKLRDDGSTGYGESEVYTLKLAPEPASAGLLLVGSVFAICRRRRR